MKFSKRVLIIIISMMLFTSQKCLAEHRQATNDSNFFSGITIGYENITTSANEYGGLKYGFVVGKDWDLGKNFGFKSFLGLTIGTMISTRRSSDKVQATSPAFGLGLSYQKLTATGEILYHYTSNSQGSAQSLGLQAGLLYSLISKPFFKLQLGANLGNTIFLTKSALSYGPFLRAIWSLGE